VAELRSFIIGVAVAAALLGFGAMALGAFDNEGEGEGARLEVAATPGDASSVDFPSPTLPPTANVPVSGTPTPTPRPEVSPRDRTNCNDIAGSPYRSNAERDFFLANCMFLLVVPTQAPPIPGATYKAAAARLVADLTSQINYLAARANEPAVEDATWRQFSTQAIQSVHNIAAQIDALSVPACGAQAHQALLPAAQQARTSSDQMNQAIVASSNAAVTQLVAPLAAARGAVTQAGAAVERAPC
jgi:hypothetical protein